MKAVILAGGKGTRISEETIVRPKPMVEIGGMQIIWHIMKIYSSYGIDEFFTIGEYAYVYASFDKFGAIQQKLENNSINILSKFNLLTFAAQIAINKFLICNFPISEVLNVKNFFLNCIFTS